MEKIYVCYYGKIAHKLRNFPGIIFLKENRNVCFYDEEKDMFLDCDMNPFDITKKYIIPFSYIGVETKFFDAIKNNGGIIPCSMENINVVEHWSKYYKTIRKTKIIKGRDLINESILNELEREYGEILFFKTVEKAYSDKIRIADLREHRTLIHTAISLHPDDEFMISEYINLLDDEIGTKEYRIFVYNNQILNISRHTEFILHSIPEYILTKALEVIEKLKGKDFPSAYVLDLGEYIDHEGNKQIDVIEFNPFFSSGHYLYNSMDFLPCDDMIHTNINNIAIEYSDLINFCRLPDNKYKNILKPSKYFGSPGSFAYDLKYINDFDLAYNSDDSVNPGKLVDKYLNRCKETKTGSIKQKNNLMSDILKAAREETDMHIKQTFIENIKCGIVPIKEEYLCSDVFPSDFEERKIYPQTITVNKDLLNRYMQQYSQDKEIKKLVKKKDN